MNIRHSNYDVIHRLAPQVKGLQSNLLIINEENGIDWKSPWSLQL